MAALNGAFAGSNSNNIQNLAVDSSNSPFGKIGGLGVKNSGKKKSSSTIQGLFED